MTLRYSETVRNAGIDARIAAIGPDPTLRIYDGAGHALVTIRLPKVWMTKAADGMARKTGHWAALATARGEAKSFSICDASGSAHMSGQVPLDMTLEDAKLEVNHSVVVGTFLIRAGNG